MTSNESNSGETHLRVYANRSEFHSDMGEVEIFAEGPVSNKAKGRIKKIKDAFTAGYLDAIIDNLKRGKTTVNADVISSVAIQSLKELVGLLTSEVGRALLGLSVMQLSIKAIAPDQSIRLHKGSSNRASFSWVEGVSMRTLDKHFVTPALRKYDLLRLNADGFMMTRSLAENYPYSSLYKAKLRGAKAQWLNLIEELEGGKTDALESLKFLLSLLLNVADNFNAASKTLLAAIKNALPKLCTRKAILGLMVSHSEASDYAARLLEVSMHALMQAAVESGALGDCTVKPLSQMRSANKKHGNIGDIELLDGGDIIEAWDAKYGKSYLREEIEEVSEKLASHDYIQTVGFVTNMATERSDEMGRRVDDLLAIHGVKIEIVTYADWIDHIYERCLSSELIDEEGLSHRWIVAYAESLAQKRRNIAPIDEPCLEWVQSLTGMMAGNRQK